MFKASGPVVMMASMGGLKSGDKSKKVSTNQKTKTITTLICLFICLSIAPSPKTKKYRVHHL